MPLYDVLRRRVLELKNRPKSLVEASVESIRNSIIRGELVLGQPLTEVALSQALGISKTPVREALSVLKSEGIVVSETHKGYKVFSMNQEQLVAFCELRFALESQALRYAVERNPEQLDAQLNATLQQMEQHQGAEDREDYLRLDTEFHRNFFLASSNSFLLEHYDQINSMIETLRHYISRSDEATQTSLAGHVHIARLIHSGHLSEAIAQLDEHIVQWSRRNLIPSLNAPAS